MKNTFAHYNLSNHPDQLRKQGRISLCTVLSSLLPRSTELVEVCALACPVEDPELSRMELSRRGDLCTQIQRESDWQDG